MNGIISIVPFKGNTNCKSRLRSVLSNSERKQVALTMLERVLKTLAASTDIQGRLLVGGNQKSWEIAKDHSFHVLPDHGPGLNHNLCRAINFARHLGYEQALILPADLPFINSLEVERLVDLGKQYDAVVVPSKEGTGTNALLITLDLNFSPAFGPNSFELHVNNFRRMGAFTREYRSSLLSIDLDDPEDWKNWGSSLLGKAN